jgi:hypothetical protein
MNESEFSIDFEDNYNQYIRETIQEIVLYSYLIVFLAGFIGNILAFIVFSRSAFKNASFSIYFRTLALIDLTVLLLMLNRFIDLKFNIRIIRISKSLCGIFPYLAYSLPSISSHLLVIISFDRVISIYGPTKYLIRNKKSFQIITCASILIFNFAFYIPTVAWFKFVIADGSEIDLDNENNTLIDTDCILLDNYTQIFYWMDVLNSLLIPFLVMSTITFITMNILFKSRKRVNLISSVEYSVRGRDFKFARTSVLLNMIFLTFNMPLFVYTILYDVLKDENGRFQIEASINILISSILLLVYYCNYGSTFFIHLLFNQIFRNEFCCLFRKKQSHLAKLILQINKNANKNCSTNN